MKILGWRDVPVDSSAIGKIATETEPYVKQIFIGKSDKNQDDFAFNLKLFTSRKQTELHINGSKLSESARFYLPSLFTKIIIFKGLLVPKDVKHYNKDFQDPSLVAPLALVDQRFSTNTFPT